MICSIVIKFLDSLFFGRKTLPSDDLEELPKNNIEVKIVEEAGHSMAWENPEGLAQIIYECLK